MRYFETEWYFAQKDVILPKTFNENAAEQIQAFVNCEHRCIQSKHLHLQEKESYWVEIHLSYIGGGVGAS